MFFQLTETCEYNSVCLERERERESQPEVSQQKSDRRVEVQDRVETPKTKETKETGGVDKQGLFVEFIQFLVRIGMFNEQVVMSMLSNKELFL